MAILVAMIALSTVLNMQNKATLRNGLNVATEKSMLASIMKSATLEIGIAMRNIGLQSDLAAMKDQENKVKAQRKRYDDAREKLLSIGLSANERKIIDDLTSMDNEVAGAFKLAVQQVGAFNSEAAAKTIAEKIDPVSQRALAELSKLVDIQQNAAKDMLDGSDASDKQLLMVMVGCGAAALILGIVCAYIITHSITRPLHDAIALAARVADGELTAQVNEAGKDEVGDLLHALRMMVESLVRTVSEVRAGTDTITIASREIASGNADLSARTEAQASSLEETASSMEELTHTVKQNADNARQANQLAFSASAVAAKGGDVVSQVVETMGAIKERSSKIVDIIGVIDGIAFQTNILALNAAVEAARAGEQGRGFAVVASEVRSLAQRSASAAKEIKSLIGDSVEKVDLGAQLVDEAGQTMNLIVSSVKQVADIMGEITSATQTQSAGIEEINVAISQMDEMTQQNAALVEQAAAAAESMEEQAHILHEAVRAFKLNANAQNEAIAKHMEQHKHTHEVRQQMRAQRQSAQAAAPKRLAASSPPKHASSHDDGWEEF
ncbi:methyl-accepting chemotaxis protein [Massilia sp. W12]|uniref:methyl-accepting chemotaxis protein n=1 Tax=Massilia sp. W12 TaxID=3126507 RepID=UPI0030D391E1